MKLIAAYLACMILLMAAAVTEERITQSHSGVWVMILVVIINVVFVYLLVTRGK